MKQFLLAVSLLTLIGTQASAGFLTNRQEWNNASETKKLGYVQGVYSEMTLVWPSDTQDTLARKRAKKNCAQDLGLTDRALVEIVDSHYTDLENWTDPANIALHFGMVKICKVYK